ncbi:Elongation factor 1-gamma, partial [Coemansia sp. RSA 2052]
MAFTKIFKSKKGASTPTTRSAATTPRVSRENLRDHNNPMEMAPIGTIIGPTTNNTRNYKARVVAQFLGIDLATTPDFVMNVDNKKEEYLAKYPAGKVPVFEGANGLNLTDSSAIAYYVASQAGSDSPLLGQTAEETAQILQHLFFAEADFMSAVAGALYSIQGFVPYIKPAQQYAEEQLFRFLGVLNTILLDKTFLVAERITVADVVLACDLMTVYTAYLTSDDRKKYRNVTRYFKTMISQPAFKAVVGEVALCVERVKPQPPANAAKKADKAEKKAEKKP